MAANNHPEPQLLSQDTDEQGTVAAPDDSSLIGTEPDEVIGNLKVGSTGSVEGEDSGMPQSPGPGGKPGNTAGPGADLSDGADSGPDTGASGAGTEEAVQPPPDDHSRQS
jgi:hypothetical protein